MKNFLTIILFILGVTLIRQNVNAQCAIKKTVDKFNGETTFRTPILKPGSSVVQPVFFTKVLKADGSVLGYFMSLTAYGSIPIVDGEGAIILFTDGNKEEYPTRKVDVEVSGGSYEYSVFMSVREIMMEIYTDRAIDAFKLHIFERTLTNGEREKVKECAKAIIAAR